MESLKTNLLQDVLLHIFIEKIKALLFKGSADTPECIPCFNSDAKNFHQNNYFKLISISLITSVRSKVQKNSIALRFNSLTFPLFILSRTSNLSFY